MYESFYNLKAEPFRLSPDHRFCFEHKGYAKARAYMAYAFKRAEGFVMVTGRPGTGKTTLIGELVESLSRDKVFTANLVCTQLSADDLLKSVAYSFGIGSAKLDKAELLQRLTILFHRWHREGRRALLIVDEAQDLSTSAMEELRLLTNIQIGGQPLLQIFLLGQPELRDLILSTAMEQVHQRIVAASHIDELEAEETEGYVMHRLVAVGWNGDPAIDRAIFPLIHKFSEGVPRRINLICSRLFLLGSVEQRHTIELEDVRVVISELQAENLAAGTGFSPQDFQVSGSSQWVAVPVEAAQLRPDPQQQAVDRQPFIAAPEELPASAFGAKKKDLSEVAPISPVDRANDSIDVTTYGSDFETESEDDTGNASFYRNDEWVSEVRQVDPDSGAASVGATARRTAESRLGWGRGVALLVLMIVTMVVSLTLYVYFSRQEHRTRAEYQSEAQASMNYGDELSVALNPPSGVDAEPMPLVTEPQDSLSLVSASAVPAVAEDSMPVAAESTYAQVPQDSTDGPILHSLQPEDLVAEQAYEQTSASVTVDEENAPSPETTAQPQKPEHVYSVSFAFDSDELLPDANQALDRALEKLRDEPYSLASITGFTDSQGDENYNLELSRKRANAVEQYLVEAGVARQRLQVEGRGVLNSLTDDQHPGAQDEMEPHRIVQIKLSSDISQ